MKNHQIITYIPFLLCLLLSMRFAQAQAPEVILELENVQDNGTEVRFDLTLYAERGHLLNFAQGDLSLDFDVSQFGPDLALVVGSGVLKEAYCQAEIVDLPEGGKALQVNWNLHQEESAFPMNFSNGAIPQVDPAGVLLGSFTLLGKTGGGDAGLQWREKALYPTEVWNYRSADFHVEKASATLSEGGALPVELLAFRAERQVNNEVQLNWATANEQNSSHFEVEKRLNQGDFHPIGRIEAAGQSTTQQAYRFTDRTFMTPVVHYRLKQVDLDGTFSYSKVLEVQFDPLEGQYQVYPNPVVSQLKVSFNQSSEGIHRYELSDLQGRILMKGNWDVGSGTLGLDISVLAGGTYQLVLQDNQGKRYTQRVLKQR